MKKRSGYHFKSTILILICFAAGRNKRSDRTNTVQKRSANRLQIRLDETQTTRVIKSRRVDTRTRCEYHRHVSLSRYSSL